MFTPPRYILAPYLATPPDVVERMLELAQVCASDCVYDIGCGDGRVAITAAVRYGARGHGVDIEPYWIEQARAQAQAAGVADRVSFEQIDATELDLRPASVVLLYLVHWSTQHIALQLLDQCRPGTRVVSHSFGFEAIAGTKTETFVDADGEPRRLHLWKLPDQAAQAGDDLREACRMTPP